MKHIQSPTFIACNKTKLFENKTKDGKKKV